MSQNNDYATAEIAEYKRYIDAAAALFGHEETQAV